MFHDEQSKCPECGARVFPSDTHCMDCGADLIEHKQKEEVQAGEALVGEEATDGTAGECEPGATNREGVDGRPGDRAQQEETSEVPQDGTPSLLEQHADDIAIAAFALALAAWFAWPLGIVAAALAVVALGAGTKRPAFALLGLIIGAGFALWGYDGWQEELRRAEMDRILRSIEQSRETLEDMREHGYSIPYIP